MASTIGKYTHITGTDTQVQLIPGTLKKVIVNDTGTNYTIALYDEADSSKTAGKLIAAIATDATGTIDFDVSLKEGLYVDVGGTAGDCTIVTD